MTDPGTGTVRLLLVDDENLMRAGLRLMIDGAEGIEVVGEEADGAGALRAVDALDPDVVLMDIRMPGMDGIEATRRLHAQGARAAIVVLTAFDTDGFLLDALRAGAVSFLLKDTPPQDVVQAVHEAAQGRARFSPLVLRRLVDLAAGGAGGADGSRPREPRAGSLPDGAPRGASDSPGGALPTAPAGRLPAGVTAREWEVAQLVAQGLTNGEIGEALFLSLPTVKTHVGRLFDKLHVTNRVQLAIRVLELQA
ncbi:response regulator transcription factor [Brachybacterium phenoliresistens]|uniref:response regulator transcription factor n=1 Tax=Brachybacterium phenoliresistens TaxID=396014 RepID=UPI0031D460DD